MQWNKSFCEKVITGELEVPTEVSDEEEMLLKQLLEQARTYMFNPDELHFQWLVWKATKAGLHLEKSEKNFDVGFFYQITL